LSAESEKTHTRGSGFSSVLSPRELQVIDLQSRGLRYKQIAAELGITRETVKHHLVRARLKIADKENARPDMTL
jgi:DNA-binding CsgD family transcriptional regulator